VTFGFVGDPESFLSQQRRDLQLREWFLTVRVTASEDGCKTEGRVEISATVSEDVAEAPSSEDPLARGGKRGPRDIAETRFVSQGDARILERLAA
jgi:hypothetical protein